MQNLAKQILSILKNNYLKQKINERSQIQQAYYDLAKSIQSKQKNYQKAAYYYFLVIQEKGTRLLSSIKDFGSLYHQCGFTAQAIEFLKQCMKHVNKKQQYQFENLIQNLIHQIINPSGNHHNKNIYIKNIPKHFTQFNIRNMFFNASRIQNIKFFSDLSFTEQIQINAQNICLLTFQTYSAGHRTFQVFKFQQYPFIEMYWVNECKFISNALIHNKLHNNQNNQDLLKLLYPFYYSINFLEYSAQEQKKLCQFKQIWNNNDSLQSKNKWDLQINTLKQYESNYTGQQLENKKRKYIIFQNEINLFHLRINKKPFQIKLNYDIQ